jgi:RHS repeat-associated protein
MLTSSPQPTANPFLHNGEQADPTGLYYLRDRCYDPSTGRFLGVDPAGGSPYRYADNNPVSNSDPSGRDTIGELAVTMDLASNLASYDYCGVAITYYRQWDPTFGEVSATINQSGGSDSIGLYQVGTGSLNNDVDSQIKNYENGFLAGIGNSLTSAVVSLTQMTVDAASYVSPAGALFKSMFDSFFDPQTLAVLSDPFFASGPGAGYGMEQGKVAGTIAQMFVPGVGEEEMAADAARLEAELPILEKDAQEVAAALPDRCLNSFEAGTVVQMADGSTKRIEEVHAGDWVLSRAPRTMVIEPSRVLATIQHTDTATVRLTVIDSAGQSQAFTCTPEHPFYVVGRNWVEAGGLKSGDSLLTGSGSLVRVASVTPHASAGKFVVYNLTIGDHSYFVGSDDGGVWVHNACGDPWVDSYGALSGDLSGTEYQAHHLNQNAVYGLGEEGISTPLHGSAFTDFGDEHYNAHSSLEEFWDQYREGGDKEGTLPTNNEYGEAVYDSMLAAGKSPAVARALADVAKVEREANGFLGSALVPRIPNKINQSVPWLYSSYW